MYGLRTILSGTILPARPIALAFPNLLRELKAAGMTMLVVSHEMRFARDAADRVIFMDHGVIVEEGSPAQVFGAPQEPRTKAFIAELTR